MDLVSTKLIIFELWTNLNDLAFVIYALIEYVNESLISNFKMSIIMWRSQGMLVFRLYWGKVMDSTLNNKCGW
jgi:hypothetical protein